MIITSAIAAFALIVIAATSARSTVIDFPTELAKRENLTIRQTYERIIPSIGPVMMIGSGKDIADEMEDWYRSKACDGFNIHIAHQPGGFTNFVDYVTPELQKRGIFRKEYQGGLCASAWACQFRRTRVRSRGSLRRASLETNGAKKGVFVIRGNRHRGFPKADDDLLFLS